MLTIRKKTAAVLACAAVALSIPLTSAARADIVSGGSTCPQSFAQIPGVKSEAAWSPTQSYSYNAGQTWCMYNPTANRRVVWQTDGNLVAYEGTYAFGRATWASNTSGKGVRLSFRIDGNIVIYDNLDRRIWQSYSTRKATPGKGYGFAIREGSPRRLDVFTGPTTTASWTIG